MKYFAILFISLINIKFVYLNQMTQLVKNELSLRTRRILRGSEVGDTRPYMVYLRPATTETKLDPSWLCGGVIIHSQFILTSAACIADVKNFYVVSGTHRWIPVGANDECIRNGAKKAVWKCVPQNYVFDGDEIDNIRWMINDIAVVRVEEDFNFDRRIRGCDFVPKKIAYNNQSEDLEKPGTAASIAGWGTTDSFGDVYGRTTENSPDLLETDVMLISKKNCKARWPERYHHIIEGNMVCAKDSSEANINDLCKEQGISCKELVYSDEEEDSRRHMLVGGLDIHSARHGNATRRSKVVSGGFCENDHGGPLVVGYGTGSMVVGVISACQTANFTQKCYGPYLYTSVWKNRHLIGCAVNKDIAASCKRLLRSSQGRMRETIFSWENHPEGAAKSETKQKPLRMGNTKRAKHGAVSIVQKKITPKQMQHKI